MRKIGGEEDDIRYKIKPAKAKYAERLLQCHHQSRNLSLDTYEIHSTQNSRHQKLPASVPIFGNDAGPDPSQRFSQVQT